ncbi:MAG: SDR family NAD(P)-dependent oxidoreductase [Clostridiales bacterium]|nr:SDR family NAD(P)-dependent oxidoreductase [Clostridiales bacterium]
MNANKVVLITGGSDGIGLSAAKIMAGMGHRVYEISRRESSQPGINHLGVDVTDPGALQGAVAEIIAKEKKLDILICNAGIIASGSLEFTEAEKAKYLFDVNYFGVLNSLQAALPYLRASRGSIVFVSSAAAVLPIPFHAHYSASKAAINALSLALTNELKPFGVRVRTIMPGDAKTGLTAARQKSHGGDEIYGGRISRSVAVMERDEQKGMPAEAVAKVVVKAALSGRKPLMAAGIQYRLFAVIAKFFPARFVNRIVGSIYGGK